MEKKSDALLRRILKNWVNQQRPPENGRVRLLWDAAQVSQHKIDLSVILLHPQLNSHSSSNDWTQSFFFWINENSIQLRIQPRII
jgi:hypothetical protein